MDYIRFQFQGEWDDVPLAEIKEGFKMFYSDLAFDAGEANFDDDIHKETAANP